MRVLLTGQQGYVGAVVAPSLVAAGHDVVGLDTMFYGDCDFFPPPSAVPLLQLDVRDVTSSDLEGFEAVVHLAGLSNDPLGDMNPELTYDINLRATLSLARAARAAGVRRFVFASSCSMYGTSGPDEWATEGAPLKPLSAYAESKARAEEGLSALADDGFSPIFMRFATAYGLSPRLRLDLVVNNLMAWAFTTGKVRILSDGTPWRPIIHVGDMAESIRLVLEAPVEEVHSQAFNVGANSENYQVRDLAEIVRDTVPNCTIEYAGSGDPDPRSYRVDFGKFSGAFPQFRVAWTARSGARELLEAYRAFGLTFEAFEGERYVRLRRLNGLRAIGALDDDLRWRSLAPATADSR
jgi:nucleoside-diphosphate-sugar epimerase